MHSNTTERTRPLWDLVREEKFEQALEQAEEIVDELEEEGGEEGEPETNGEGPLPDTGQSGYPDAYWDALIITMLSRLALDQEAETWDALERLLPCSDPEYRHISVGLARMIEGLLIRRMDEMGDPEDSQKSLKRGAEELEDRVLTYDGELKESAPPEDLFLAGFAGVLGLGKWKQMKKVRNILRDREDQLKERERDLLAFSDRLLELQHRCTPEKLEEVRGTGIPGYYSLLLELMEWSGSGLEDL